MTSLINKKCMECQESFPGSTLICPHDGSQLATTLARSATGLMLCDRYEMLEPIGRGGMGIIHKARDTKASDPTKDIVAIKLLINDTAGNETMRTRFMVEARAASLLSHPNIIKVYEYDVSPEGLPYMVMEYLEGFPLDDLVNVGEVETIDLLYYAIEVCDALAHAHRRNVIHSDIKPSNIMIVRGEEVAGKAVVVDFGIAKIFTQPGKASLRLTQTGEVFGSPLYMSPEQCMGQKLDHRSDVYALGCLLYECLTGEAPFAGDNFLSVIFQHINDRPPRFAKKGVDYIIEPVVLKALEKKPDDRYQSMVELRQALEHVHRTLASGEHDTAGDDHAELDDDAAVIGRITSEAEAGDPNAMYDLGLFYRFGHFMDEPDQELGFKWCLKAAEHGLAAAQNCVGECLQHGWGTEINHERSIFWYQAAAGQGDPEATANLGFMYESGNGVDVDITKAIKWYQQAAEMENLFAQKALASLYKFGKGDLLEPDFGLAYDWHLSAANQGDVESQIAVGEALKFGEGVESNPEQAFAWFQAAAEQGDCTGQRWLGVCYDEGYGVPQNSLEAVRWISEAARNGDGPAHTWLGFWTAHGENGLPVDHKKAVSYFREAIELGDAASIYQLGRAYIDGNGVVQNHKTALHWFKTGAKKEQGDCQYELAMCYRNGTGTEPDEKLFMRYIRKAAEQRVVEAQYELGLHYKKQKKWNNATKWLKLAIDQGHKKARRALEQLELERPKRSAEVD